MRNKQIRRTMLLTILVLIVAGCAPATPAPATDAPPKVVLLLGGPEDDKGFNEYTLKGTREAATELGMEFTYHVSSLSPQYEQDITQLLTESPDIFIAVSIPDPGALARVAQAHPEITFALIEQPYFPGFGCSEEVADCYSAEGGLSNVTSLMFAEDEVAYLAGALAACMSQNDTIASVAGQEFPALVRFVTGFENGARSVNPEIEVLNRYLPTFDDPELGKIVAQEFITEGADVLFAVAGKTGTGALQAAHEAGVMAIGVDVDQYHSYPEVRGALLTSAMKNVDIAAAAAVRDFVAGNLKPGIRTFDLANAGLGLAPYHEWESRIPELCKQAVEAAEIAVKADPTITGAKP